MAGQSSFAVHVAVALTVVVVARFLKCELWQWAVLLACMALVLSLELVNSALESLARGVCTEQNRDVGRALDIAAGAVLLAALFAALIGTLIFAMQLGWLGQIG